MSIYHLVTQAEHLQSVEAKDLTEAAQKFELTITAWFLSHSLDYKGFGILEDSKGRTFGVWWR